MERILFTEEQIRARVNLLGEQLTREYKDKFPVVVCILKGASFFYTDLCRAIHTDIYMDFISVSSYGSDAQSSGVVRLVKDLNTNITGRDVLLVEDIIDSGLTLSYLKDLFNARRPNSFKTICLLEKIGRKNTDYKVDHVGFQIPNEFVVGFGLDFNQKYRNLPYVGVLKEECYKS
ncbi:MAG: hypoxanthine phosphoribosyltransferase [Erysipelotrichaceae bacterium]|nr:hypoxanthine phosphoribosyltransferase [Erysipelotrichaceae bacterium]